MKEASTTDGRQAARTPRTQLTPSQQCSAHLQPKTARRGTPIVNSRHCNKHWNSSCVHRQQCRRQGRSGMTHRRRAVVWTGGTTRGGGETLNNYWSDIHPIDGLRRKASSHCPTDKHATTQNSHTGPWSCGSTNPRPHYAFPVARDAHRRSGRRRQTAHINLTSAGKTKAHKPTQRNSRTTGEGERKISQGTKFTRGSSRATATPE